MLAHRNSKRSDSPWIWGLISLLPCLILLDGTLYEGGDSSLYLEQGVALAEGTLDEFVARSLFMHEHSDNPPGPVLYPVGMTLTVAAIYSIFGLNAWVLKLTMIAAWVGTVIVAHTLFFSRLPSRFRYLATSFFALNFTFYHSASSTFLSDILFMFVSTCALWLYDFRSRRTDAILSFIVLGLVVGAAITVRPNGFLLALVFTVLWARDSGWRLRKRISSIAALWIGIGIVVIGLSFLQPAIDTKYVSYLEDASLRRFPTELLYNLDLVKRLFAHPILYYGVTPIVSLGLWKYWSEKKLDEHVLYVVATLLLYSTWPFRNGVRFLFPILPFVTYVVFLGFAVLADRLEAKLNKGLGRTVTTAAFLLVLLNIGGGVRHTVMALNRDIPAMSDFEEIQQFVSEARFQVDYLVYENPRPIRFATELPALRRFKDCAPSDFRNSPEGEPLFVFRHESRCPELVSRLDLELAGETEHFVVFRWPDSSPLPRTDFPD